MDRTSKYHLLVGAVLAAFLVLSINAQTNNLSSFGCTANDVRIIGSGVVLNEPCVCMGFFDANVNFTVENNANSDRTCITLNLCQTVAGQCVCQDVQLDGTLPGKKTLNMTANIGSYPCGSGFNCFGSTTDSERGPCDSGCCSTVTWRIPGQDPDCEVTVRQINSKCRHQQICIQGRAPPPELECTNGNCNSCGGGSLTLCSETSGTFELLDASGNVVGTPQVVTTPVGGLFCATFANLQAGTYTGNVTDAGGCEKESTEATLAPQSTLTAPDVSLTSSCNPTGSVTLLAVSTGAPSGTTYTWSGVVCAGGQTSNTCTFTPSSLLTSCQSVATVIASAGGCDSPPTTVRVEQCISSRLC